MGVNSLPETVIAKFYYTDPTRTRTDFFCGETPLGPCGSGRVRVVEFSFYPTASRLRFEPGPFCARVQHAANHSATEPSENKSQRQWRRRVG